MAETEIPQSVWMLARRIAEEMAQGHPVNAAPTASLEFAVACDAAARAIMADRAARAPDPSREMLREALTAIASMKGRTLISVEHGQPYSIGANDAFEQTADIALSAIEASK